MLRSISFGARIGEIGSSLANDNIALKQKKMISPTYTSATFIALSIIYPLFSSLTVLLVNQKGSGLGVSEPDGGNVGMLKEG